MANISSLINAVKGDVVTPEHPEYSSAIARWARNANRNAKVVVFVKDAQDVVAGIAYARENKLPFAIRGGGHNAAGASSVEGGVVVDLSRYVNTVRVDPEAKLGYVGGGALWRDVDREAIKYGLATVGGTVNHTGVGGLVLGGGYGWLSGRHGLAVDNLRQATVVTADGSILTANEKENPDLFWGIRGGGSNFGVITEFVLQLHPQRKTVFAGPVVYTGDKAEQVLEVTKKWWPNMSPDEGVIQAATVQDGHPILIVFFFYNGSESDGRAIYKAFFDIEHVADATKELPYEELNAMQNATLDHGRCWYLTGTAQKEPNTTTMLEGLKKCADVAATGGFIPALLHEYWALHKINSIPSSETPFSRLLTPNVLITLTWDSDEPDKTQKARETANQFKEIINRGQSLSNSEKIGYTNYDMDSSGKNSAAGWDDKARQGFGVNYPRLQKVKKQYDPDVFFNRWFPIAPA